MKDPVHLPTSEVMLFAYILALSSQKHDDPFFSFLYQIQKIFFLGHATHDQIGVDAKLNIYFFMPFTAQCCLVLQLKGQVTWDTPFVWWQYHSMVFRAKMAHTGSCPVQGGWVCWSNEREVSRHHFAPV